MDKVSLSIIIDKLKGLSLDLYNEDVGNSVQKSFELDSVIDDLEGWLKYLPMSPKDSEIDYICGVLHERFNEIVELVNLLIEEGVTQKEIEKALRYNFQTIMNWAEFGFQKD